MCPMSELGFWIKSDLDLKIASLGPLLVGFFIVILSDKSQIFRFLGLIFCLAPLNCPLHDILQHLALL